MNSRPSPAVAALLSFVFPGLGQWYAGQPRRALLWALPTLALIALALVILAGGMHSLLDLVFLPQNVTAFVIGDLAFFFYHVAAMFDAHGLAMRQRGVSGPAGAAPMALTALIVAALLLHGLPGATLLWGSGRIGDILPGQSGIIPPYSPGLPTFTPAPSATPSTSSTPGVSSPTPSLEPGKTYPPINAAWAADDRLNVLLIGTDAGPGRRGGRTDTMILLSVQISTGKAAMFGFPRNMYNVPLPEDANGKAVSNRIFIDPFYKNYGSTAVDPHAGLLTNIWQRAHDNPNQFYTPQGACPAGTANLDQCLAEARGWRATTAVLQNLAGVQVDGVIAVNLAAFRQLVDAIGGVWIDVPYAIHDDHYPTGDGVSPRVIDIAPGCQKLDGIYALAFARSRHQASDYQRMRRQQLVLQAVRRQIDPLAVLPQLPTLLDIAADNLYSTFARAEMPDLAQVAARVNADRLYKVFFNPGAGFPAGLSSDEIASIHDRVANIFSQPEPKPTPSPSDGGGCPPKP
jgi:LCP family protein required for cell wall assembly